MHIGTPPQKISVLLDTGSSFSYFHSASCKYGNSKKSEVNNNFYEGNSKSYSTLKYNTLESLIFKDKDLLGIDGALSSDLLHIGDLSSYIKRENKTNVSDNNNRFNFGLITKIDKANAKSNNLTFYKKDEEIHVYDSSVLGLSFNSDDNFLDYLFKQNFIFRRIFSFYQANYETKINNKIYSSSSESYSKWRFYVGDYPPEVEAYPSNSSTCFISKEMLDLTDEEFKGKWVCDLTHGLLGQEINFNNTFEIDGYAAFYSGYRYILAPSRFLSIYKQKLISIFGECYEKVDSNSETVLVCKKKTPKVEIKFSFVLGGFSHEIPYESFFKPNNKEELEFMIRFTSKNKATWVFGQLFLSQFTTTFDKDNRSINFFGGCKQNFTAEVEAWENKIYLFQTTRMMYLSWLLVCLLGILFVVFVCYICYRTLRRRILIGDDVRPLVNIK